MGMYRPPNPGPKLPPPPRDELGERDEAEAEAAWKRGPVCDEREKGMGWAVGVLEVLLEALIGLLNKPAGLEPVCPLYSPHRQFRALNQTQPQPPMKK